ncbi:MAG: portal protein [Candidatus Kryptonium sp.]
MKIKFFWGKNMPNLNDVLNRLQKTVLGSSDINQLDTLSKLVLKLKEEIPDNVSDFVTHIISIGDKKFNIEDLIEKEIPQVYPEYKRIYRYREYKAIAKMIPYVRRALHVITQNIISPDDYTKTIINMIKFSSVVDNVVKKQIQEIMTDYKFDMISYDIIFNTLLYGDMFVEIVDENTIHQLAKIALREENESFKEFAIEMEKEYKNGYMEIILENNNIKPVNADAYERLLESKKSRRKKDSIKLVQHFPGNVIVLGNKDFVLGYLVFIDDMSELLTAGNLKQLVGPAKQATTLSIFSTGLPSSFEYDKSVRSFLRSLADSILNKIFTHYKIDYTRLNQLSDVIEGSKKEMINLLYTLIYLKTADRNELTLSSRVRFVPAGKMVHFKLKMGSEPAFLPYGTSKLYGLEYIARALIALETSILLYRITRSVDRRIFHVERGASRDVQSPIQQVIRALTRRRYGVFSEQYGIDEIPSHISSMEEIFMPMDNGKRYIEVDVLQSGNLNITMDDWRELRDALVAGLEVPPAYLALEQSYETRATLSSENVVFASTILAYQREFGEMFTELLSKLYYYRYGNTLSKDVRIEFKPPIKLLLERYSEMASSFSQLAEVAKMADVDPVILFKRFFGEFAGDEETLERSVEKLALKLLKPNNEEETGAIGGGGFSL